MRLISETGRRLLLLTCFFTIACGSLCMAVTGQTRSQQSADTDGPGPAEPPAIVHAPGRTEARQRAEMLHELLHDMLLAVHKNYYREDEGLLLPATTFRNVFEQFGKRQSILIRWLAVDAEPMNVEHTAKSEFEIAAVIALKTGEAAFEDATENEYSYAGSIALTAECLKCHVPGRTSTRTRSAAIVIRMPIQTTMDR